MCLPAVYHRQAANFELAELQTELSGYMVFTIISESATAPLTIRRHPMWVIELNFAGRQFTHRVADRRQRLYRLATRTVGWRPSQFRNQQAA